MISLDIDNDTALDDIDYCSSANLAFARPVLDKIADKWTILILTAISNEPKRFNEIKRQLNITHKALADALKRLERIGLITRSVLPTSPIGVEYAITPLGLSLRTPFHALCAWALDNVAALDEAEAQYDLAKKTTV